VQHVPLHRVAVLRDARAHPFPRVALEHFAQLVHRREQPRVDAALHLHPLALRRRQDPEFQHEHAARREPVDERRDQRRLVVGVVQRRRQQDHVELLVGQLVPAAVQELAPREARLRALHELRAVVDADDAAGADVLREAAEEPLVAAHVEERPADEVGQRERLELVEGAGIAGGAGEGLVLGGHRGKSVFGRRRAGAHRGRVGFMVRAP
jgi:hypothetical protein